MTIEELKQYAKSFGADLVGIASLDRFEGCPPQMDPRFIMPEAKSMIVMAFRVMRGSLRGIEEGTFFSNYSANSVSIEMRVNPSRMVLLF